jgi:hypothetical protein
LRNNSVTLPVAVGNKKYFSLVQFALKFPVSEKNSKKSTSLRGGGARGSVEKERHFQGRSQKRALEHPWMDMDDEVEM